MSKEAIFKAANESIVEIEEERALEIIAEAEAEGVDMVELLSQGYSAGMRELGDRFGRGDVFLPELIFASELMKSVTEVIESKMDTSQIKKKGSMVIGTVAGDVHDIGKGIVASLVKTIGIEVHDLGREVPAEEFIKKAIEFDVDFIGSSALLTTTMLEQRRIEELLEEANLKGKVKTLIGGAPVTQRWADKIGADSYCEDATDTVNYISELLK